jgi:hypothetical protein
MGFGANKHVLLYGKPGHAKSDMAEYIFTSNGLVANKDFGVLQLHKSSTFEDVIGPFNVPEYRDNGKMSYNLEEGMLNFEYVILEEFLDVSPSVAAILKDILTRGDFCVGGVCYKIKTKMIVACTNHNPMEWAKNDSELATIKRFAYQCNVKWPNYTASEYDYFFKKKFGKSNLKLAAVIQMCYENGFQLSPRDASHAYEVYNANGLQGLQFLFNLPEFLWNKILAEINTLETQAVNNVKLKDLVTQFNDLRAQATGKKLGALDYGVKLKTAKELQTLLGELTIKGDDDQNWTLYASTTKELTDFINKIEKAFFSAVKT